MLSISGAFAVCRRKANRESAARVRLKRQQLVDELEVQVRHDPDISP